MSKCVSSSDAYVEVRENKVIVVTYAFTLEVEVEKVKDARLVRGSWVWLSECGRE